MARAVISRAGKGRWLFGYGNDWYTVQVEPGGLAISRGGVSLSMDRAAAESLATILASYLAGTKFANKEGGA